MIKLILVQLLIKVVQGRHVYWEVKLRVPMVFRWGDELDRPVRIRSRKEFMIRVNVTIFIQKLKNSLDQYGRSFRKNLGVLISILLSRAQIRLVHRENYEHLWFNDYFMEMGKPELLFSDEKRKEIIYRKMEIMEETNPNLKLPIEVKHHRIDSAVFSEVTRPIKEWERLREEELKNIEIYQDIFERYQ